MITKVPPTDMLIESAVASINVLKHVVTVCVICVFFMCVSVTFLYVLMCVFVVVECGLFRFCLGFV